MPRSRSILAALAAAAPLLLQADFNPETGSTVYQYYSQDQYGASMSPQNWAIAQDTRGVMYFGNTGGLLEFDGQWWKTIGLNNGSFVRSLAVDERGTVYVGGVGDFGFLQPGTRGEMRFVSLLGKIPEQDRKFSDVWRILPTANGVYLSAYERLFRLKKDGSIKVWRPASNFGRAFYVLHALYVKTREQGLMRMEGDQLSNVPGGAPFSKIGITDAITLDGSARSHRPRGYTRWTRQGTSRASRRAMRSKRTHPA